MVRGGAGQAPQVAREVLELVHPATYVDSIRALCESGGGAIDADTYAMPGTYGAALRAAGGAVALVDALLGGEADVGVSALRPPGHHAEAARAMGFCFFGNVAVAARRATSAHGLSRVMIVDWDVHHGNGTNDIFHADADVLFVSIHESPLYPGTGPASDVGSGAGEGYTVNLPVPGGSGNAAYRSLVEHVACGLIRAVGARAGADPAGFDAHRDDPLATCRVTEAGFAGMAASLRRGPRRRRAARRGAGGRLRPRRARRSMAAVMPVLVDASTPGRVEVEVHPLARGRASGCAWWPGLLS